MADLFTLESTADVAAGAAGSRLGTTLDTGVLRRKYNFGDRVSELQIAQDPFFRLVSKIAKKPTDDPSLNSQKDDRLFIKGMHMLLHKEQLLELS